MACIMHTHTYDTLQTQAQLYPKLILTMITTNYSYMFYFTQAALSYALFYCLKYSIQKRKICAHLVVTKTLHEQHQ